MDNVSGDDLLLIIGRLYVSNVRASEALRESVVRERRAEIELSRLREQAETPPDITETASGLSD